MQIKQTKAFYKNMIININFNKQPVMQYACA
jgi:hypothetical protein